MPPLMTPALHPSPDMVGTWEAKLGQHGRGLHHQSRRIGIGHNWGRHAHQWAHDLQPKLVWETHDCRTDYLIMGKLSRGDGFTAPLTMTGRGFGRSALSFATAIGAETEKAAGPAMTYLLSLPAGERVRITKERPAVPKRSMLRFSVLPLTNGGRADGTEHSVRIVDENIEPLDLDADVDVVGVTFMTALAPRAYEIARRFKARGKTVVGGGFHPTFARRRPRNTSMRSSPGTPKEPGKRCCEDIEAGRLRTSTARHRPVAVFSARGLSSLAAIC